MTDQTSPPTLWHSDRGLYFFPLRHHSPACARHLLHAIDEIAPVEILIEGPQDYQSILDLVTNEHTNPPVAIVSFPKSARNKTDHNVTSYYPICDHSPEFVALKKAAALGVPATFIDLPSGDRMMLRHGDDDELEPKPVPLTDERAFDASGYIDALALRLGCRDQNEVWDHLFETRICEEDWRRFFHDVGTYCHHVRETTPPHVMERDGSLAREANMAGWIQERRKASSGAIMIVTGGFHTPALIELTLAGGQARRSTTPKPAEAYLIRYGFQQLDMLNGYGAGLPRPGYYERIWRQISEAERSEPWRTVALDILTEFAAHLRGAKTSPPPPVPTLSAAFEAAIQLARLRNRKGPTREDLLDACRATMMEGEETGDAALVMQELGTFLTGNRIGDIPPSAGSPPLVEAARADARRHRLNLDDGEPRKRELDIYRKKSHRAASRFLHAMMLLDTGFAQKLSGPDFISGVNLDVLFENWSYVWSPVVEARLIEQSGAADTVSGACIVELRRRLKMLASQGQARHAGHVVDVFLLACRAGVEDPGLHFVSLIEDEILADSDLLSVVSALQKVNLLWHGRDILELQNAAEVLHLIGTAYRRALFLLTDLGSVREDRLSGALEGLANLREVIETCETDTIDRVLFAETVGSLLDEELHPSLAGAMAALAFLSDLLTKETLVARMRGSVAGAYADPADKVAFLRGLMLVSRELIWRAPGIVGELDAILDKLPEDDFIALLPHLRLAFSDLDPRETDKLALDIAERFKLSPGDLSGPVSYDISSAEVQRNLEMSAKLAADFEEDQLDFLTTERKGSD